MTTPSASGKPSHKRTSSTAENNTSAPQVKRQAQEDVSKQAAPPPASKTAEPQYVYVVMIDSSPAYTDPTSDIHGVYASVKDANNAVKGIANENSRAEECSHGTNDGGDVYWISEDAGGGERMEVRIYRIEVKGVGSEPEREWGASDGGSRGDSGEEGVSEEEDEE